MPRALTIDMRVVIASLLFAGCFAHHTSDGAPGDATAEADAGPPMVDATCGGQPLDLTYVPPNMGIILDRSCSMTKKLQGSQVTKWQAAVAALDHVLSSYATTVRWGLTMFPDTIGDACTQDESQMPIAAGQASAISTLLDASLDSSDTNYPKFPCVTNIDDGVARAALDPALTQSNRSSFLMLITDGAQSQGCDVGGGDAGTEAAIHDLYANRHIPTYVVGFGSQVDAAELTTLAVKGGVPASGATKYYSADTAADIDNVFQSIATQLVSCTYKVDQVPPDLDETYVVYSGNELVPRDTTHAAGWDYNATNMTITMYGSYCDRLKDHTVTHIDVTFGCPQPPIL